MDERRRKFEKYERYAKSFDIFLKTTNTFRILDDFLSMPVLMRVITGTPLALLVGGLLPVAETAKFAFAALTSPLRLFGIKPISFRPISWSLFKVAKHINEPEMQKLLVEKTYLLDKIGENKDIVKGLIQNLALSGDDKNTRLLRDTTNAALDMLDDKDSREVLQNELVNNYFKFGINSFNPNFVTDYVKYEKSQVKKIDDLRAILERKNQRDLGVALQNLKNSIANANPENKPNILRSQLADELKKLNMTESDINVLLAKYENLKLSTAQYILQEEYAKALEKEYSILKTEIGENPNIESIREKVEPFLEEESQYKLNIQEKEYLDAYVKDYVRFEQNKGSGEN